MKKIEILGMGCPKCKQLFENAQAAVKETGVQAEIIKVEDIQKITEHNVMMTPALVIDGVVKSSGKVVSPDEIKKWIS
jgi:small redox-active disulfide protein 2